MSCPHCSSSSSSSSLLFCVDCLSDFCQKCCEERHANGSLVKHRFHLLPFFRQTQTAVTKSTNCQSCSVDSAEIYCPTCQMSMCAACSVEFHRFPESFAFHRSSFEFLTTSPKVGASPLRARAISTMPSPLSTTANLLQSLAPSSPAPSSPAVLSVSSILGNTSFQSFKLANFDVDESYQHLKPLSAETSLTSSGHQLLSTSQLQSTLAAPFTLHIDTQLGMLLIVSQAGQSFPPAVLTQSGLAANHSSQLLSLPPTDFLLARSLSSVSHLQSHSTDPRLVFLHFSDCKSLLLLLFASAVDGQTAVSMLEAKQPNPCPIQLALTASKKTRIGYSSRLILCASDRLVVIKPPMGGPLVHSQFLSSDFNLIASNESGKRKELIIQPTDRKSDRFVISPVSVFGFSLFGLVFQRSVSSRFARSTRDATFIGSSNCSECAVDWPSDCYS